MIKAAISNDKPLLYQTRCLACFDLGVRIYARANLFFYKKVIAYDDCTLAIAKELQKGASQMCKNKERKIIRDEYSRIIRGTQSCGSSSSCSEPELISSRQSSRVSIIFCISSQTERLKTDITVSICSGVPALPKCLYLLSFEDVA